MRYVLSTYLQARACVEESGSGFSDELLIRRQGGVGHIIKFSGGASVLNEAPASLSEHAFMKRSQTECKNNSSLYELVF